MCLILLSVPCYLRRNWVIVDMVLLCRCASVSSLLTFCMLLPTIMQKVASSLSLVNRDCSSLLVQGECWANYDDCMSYEEECKFVVCWWRRLNGMDEPPRKTMFVPNIMGLKKAVLAVRNEAEKCAAVNNSQPQQSVYVTFKLLLVFITRLVTLYCAGVRKPKTFVRIVVRRCHAAAEGCCDRLVCFPAC